MEPPNIAFRAPTVLLVMTEIMGYTYSPNSKHDNNYNIIYTDSHWAV